MRALVEQPVPLAAAARVMGVDDAARVERLVGALVQEGLVTRRGGELHLGG